MFGRRNKRRASATFHQPVETLEFRSLLTALYAVDEEYSTLHDQALSVTTPGVLGNDGSLDAEFTGTLSTSLVTSTSYGTLSLNSNGSFTYTPNANFAGNDSFTYKATDGTDLSDAATVVIHVTNVNAYANTENVSLIHSTPLVTRDVTTGMVYGDDDGDDVMVSVTGAPTKGTVVDNEDGTFTYTGDPDESGPDAFTFTVTDGVGTTQTNTIHVTLTNDAPSFDADAEGEFFFDEDDLPATGVIAQIHATDNNDLDEITYSIAPNSFFSVDSNTGVVTLTDADALWNAYDAAGGDDLEIDVYATDALGLCGAPGRIRVIGTLAGPPYTYIHTDAGATYFPRTAAEIRAAFDDIEAHNEKITEMIIKGHGWSGGISVDDSGGTFEFDDGGDGVGGDPDSITLGGFNVTTQLQSITNGSTVISLRGCKTAQAAANMQALIGTGLDVRGAVRYVLSIPGTFIGFGVYH